MAQHTVRFLALFTALALAPAMAHLLALPNRLLGLGGEVKRLA